MDVTGLKRFEALLQEDPLLAEKVAEVKLLMTGIAESELAEKLNDYHKEIEIPATRTRKLKPSAMRWSIAASVALLVALSAWWGLQKDSDSNIYNQYYKPDPGLMTVMSADNSNYVFEKAMVEYKTGEYGKARTAWEQLLKQKPGNDTLLYFIGAASQATDDMDVAVRYLQPVAEDSNSRFQKDALWYLGLIYLHKGDKTNAQKYLQASEHEKSGQVLQVLKK